MKVDFNVSHPHPGFCLHGGNVVLLPKTAPEVPAGAVEVCTADGREWHELAWFWERMNPAVKDTVNTEEAISQQDQMNLCISRAASLGVPLFKEDE